MISGIVLLALAACPSGGSEGAALASGKKIIECPIPFDQERDRAMLEYRCRHQGECESLVIDPQVIVLHHTATRTFMQAWNTFARAKIDPGRREVAAAGEVNVSAHFLVDRDGAIYRLMPEDKMARHAIGLNHVSIGVENVGGVEGAPLTREQILANVELVRFLVKQRPKIRWLIGHHEASAMEKEPKLWKEKDPKYRTEKPDPGAGFMSEVRARVKDLGLEGAPAAGFDKIRR